MTPSVDHQAAAHDAVTSIGAIRATIVAAVIGRAEAEREARRETPTEPAPTAVTVPAAMPSAAMPSRFGGAGQGTYRSNGNDGCGRQDNPSK
jgi:hypothetical protein